MDAPISMSRPDNTTEDRQAVCRTDPEIGLLARCREWTDIFPWLRMNRVMRMVGSPFLLLFVAAILFSWFKGVSLLLQEEFRYQLLTRGSEVSVVGHVQELTEWMKFAYQVNPSTMMLSGERLNSWRWLASGLWTLLIWSVPSLVLVRQGAVLTAGRGMESISTTFSVALRRFWPAFAATVLIFSSPTLIAILIWVINAIHHYLPAQTMLYWPCVLVLILLSTIGGLLVLASNFVLPLSLGAIVSESYPDPIDSASRGYESCFRRPLRILGYLMVLAFLLIAVFLIASGISWCAERLLFVAVGAFQTDSGPLIKGVATGLRLLPCTFVVTLFWGAVGSFYLLLRRDACEQEIEEIWMPAPKETISLPRLDTSKSES